jgi:hypothetical protein
MWTELPDIYNAFRAPHIQASIFNWSYLLCCWIYVDESMRVILQTWGQIQHTSFSFRYVNCGPGHIQCNYCSPYSGFNIQLNISPLLLEISRQANARYNADWVPYIAHTLQSTLRELWFRPYTMYLHLCIFRPQYSTKRICPAIGDISTIQWALYCNHGAKYSPHPPVYAMWTVVSRYTMQ